VLVSVNPFKMLNIYGPDQVKLYSTAATHDMPPHIYQVADLAYRRMVNEGSSQAAIISGESGAGKTEAAKLLLNYVSAVSGDTSGRSQHIKDCIRETNPLLESFGNAKTVRNNNSSRFGKYLEIFFNGDGEPIGGQTVKFLLEKTRVAFQAKEERNFHIFYQLVAGATPQMCESFGLSGQPTDFFYLAQSGCTKVDNVDDKSDFAAVQNAMTVIGISEEDKWAILQVLAGILHLGNCQFQGDTQAKCSSPENLQWASYLLELEPAQLERIIINRMIVSGRNSAYEIPQNADQAASMRDACAKSLYERVFSWLVEKINASMTQGGGGGSKGGAPPKPGASGGGPKPPGPKPPAGGGRPAPKVPGARPPPGGGPKAPSGSGPKTETKKGGFATGASKSIGVLDIYGFEIFQVNGYEQFCINYVNERLQQIFIELTLRTEQQEYHDEDMKWQDIQYFDNKIVVELIEGAQPPGIFRLLDDVCRTIHAESSQQVDQKFMAKLAKSDLAKHAHMILNQEDLSQFTIQHYAGKVRYTVVDFCFKNKDNLFSSIVMGLQNSKNKFVAKIYPEDLHDNKQAPSTSGKDIRDSAQNLIAKLSQCYPHYIRCIKSNETKSPITFDYNRVKHQVKYLGLVENVKVKKSGYAYRQYFANFINRFQVLCKQGRVSQGDKAGCMEIVQAVCAEAKTVSSEEFCSGKTKIFVKSPETIFEMDELVFKKTDPEGYKKKMEEFKKVEKIAQKHKSKLGTLGPRCVVM